MRLRIFGLLIALVTCAGAASAGKNPAQPLEQARLGEWTLHSLTRRIGNTNETGYTYEWVAKIEGRSVHVKTQPVSFNNRGLAPADLTVVDLDKKLTDDPSQLESTTTTEELFVAGKFYQCRKVEAVVEEMSLGKITIITWTSSNIPVHRIVKRVTLDNEGHQLSKLVLLEFGDKGGAEKPLARVRTN